MASIEIVQSAGYLAFLAHVKESEECYTHLGQVYSTVNGTYTGYVKFYPDEIRNSKGLVNEVCGYILASALGIPVPRYGMILIVERDRLIEAHPTLKEVVGSDPQYPAWVTQQERGVPIATHDQKTLDVLKKWPHLPSLIAFDDWLLNSDRSLKNLLRGRRGQFTCIDHGHIFGGLRWDQNLLTPDLPFAHPFVAELWNGNPPLETKSAILQAALKQQPAFASARPELEEMLGKLLGNKEETKSLLEFLERRASHGYDRMRKSLGVLV